MSVTRPSKFAGPTVRHRSALRVRESSVWADAEPARSRPTTAEAKRRCIRSCERGKKAADRYGSASSAIGHYLYACTGASADDNEGVLCTAHVSSATSTSATMT